MGLLDDAIREHLDLKRRRGADPAEVERAEREALGPVRRNRDLASPVDPDHEALVGSGWDEADPGIAPDLDADVPPAVGDRADAPVSPAYDQDATAEHAAADRVDHDEEDEPFAPEPLVAPRHEPASEDETAVHQVGEPEATTGADDEDLLEETPEFLQDTPDHDRLWFEQRPPRDFDFDG